jgi:hypothetical protein
VDSPRFSRRVCATVCALAWLVLASACATVRPEDKELLADPAMTYGSGGEAQTQEDHVLANREGSIGGGSTSGGGCGCN